MLAPIVSERVEDSKHRAGLDVAGRLCVTRGPRISYKPKRCLEARVRLPLRTGSSDRLARLRTRGGRDALDGSLQAVEVDGLGDVFIEAGLARLGDVLLHAVAGERDACGAAGALAARGAVAH